MSSSGINPLAIIAPDLYAKQLAIQRRQALAQSLMEQGGSAPGAAAYGGLRNAGNAILGAFLAKRGDQATAALYAPQPDAGQPAAASAPQISNAPSSGPVSAPQGDAVPSGPSPQISNVPPSGPSPQALGQALQGSAPPQPQPQAPLTQPRSIPSAMGQAIPDLPGMTHQQSMLAYFQSPQAYFTALAQSHALTDQQKNINSAYGADTPQAQAMMQGTLAKGASQTYRPGGGFANMATGQVATMPGPNGVQTTFPQGMYGPARMDMVPGAADALTQSTAATGLGKASTTPAIGYSPDGQPIATNAAQMLGSQPPLGLRSNNPGNLQPTGREATYGTPAEGILRASGNLDTYAKQGINTIGGIISKWAPPTDQSGKPINDTQGYISDVSQRLGVDPRQPLNLADPRVKGAVLDAIFSHENGPKAMAAAGAPQPQSLMPALPASQAPYMAGQGKDASDRHDQTITEAQGSPDRINVLDNILKLSQGGVASGPGQEFQQSVLGYAANVPGLSKIMGGAKDNAAKFQELQKFLLQNGQRAWQAAGGTGTDAQLNAASHANPNDAQFPQALQTITKWVKAGELAVQGKANAQDAYLQARGNTAQNQIAFENLWRNNLDRRVYQLQTMAPQEQQAFVKSLPPAEAKTLLQKRQNLRALGGLQ